jgi:hypothetical protein
LFCEAIKEYHEKKLSRKESIMELANANLELGNGLEN